MRRVYLVTPQGLVPVAWDPARGLMPPRVPFALDPIRGRMTAQEFAGLGNFLKKVTNAVHNVVTAPLRAISPDLVKPLDKLHAAAEKVTDKITTQVNNDLHKLGKWAKKNWKWIVIAAAIVLTIYTMGATSGLVTSLQNAWATVSTYVANHAVSLSIKVATTALSIAAKQKAAEEAQEAQAQTNKRTLTLALGMQAMERLLAGAKIGDLSPEEVEAVATVNDIMGIKLVPDELLKYFVHQPGGASAIEAVQNGEMDLDPVDTAKPAQTAQVQAAAHAAAAPVVRPVVQGQTQLRVATSEQNAAAYAASLAQSAALEADQQAKAQAAIASWAAVRSGGEDPTALYAAGGSFAPASEGYTIPGTPSAPPSWVLPVGIAAAGLAVAFLVDR